MNAISLAPWMALSLTGVAKGALIIAVALLADFLLRQRSAAMRHRVWTAVFAAALVLPLAALFMPQWHVPVLPAPVLLDASGPSPGLEPGDAGDDIMAPQPAATDSAVGDGDVQRERRVRRGTGVEADTAGAAGGWSLLGLALVAWLAGSTLLLLRLGQAAWHARALCRDAAAVTDDSWLELLHQARRRLGVDSEVELLRSSRVSMPMAWGLRRHAIVLPESADRWTTERREVVLLHELAHVRRGDCVAHLVSAAASAVHWFNPLVWIARRRQTAERELACDDAVLSSGAKGADYAWHLLEIARAAGRESALAPAGVMMARKTQLEGRLLAVLDGSRDRRTVSRSGSAALSVASLALVVGLGGLQPWAAPVAAAAETVNLNGATAGSTAAPVPPRAAAPMPAGVEEAELPQDSSARERVLQTMIGLLDDPDEDIRAQAVHSLGMMEDDRAVPALAGMLASESSAEIRSQAAWSLGMIESAEGVDALAAALTTDASDEVRSQAAWALGMIESPAGVQALNQAMGQAAAPETRSQIAWALGMIESPDGVPGLLVALGDSSASVRSQAAWALGMIESSDAVDGLISALAGDSDTEVRSQAAWALGMIEDDRALEALIDAIEDGDDKVRRQALWAVSMITG